MTEKDFSLRLAKLREEKGVSARDIKPFLPSVWGFGFTFS